MAGGFDPRFGFTGSTEEWWASNDQRRADQAERERAARMQELQIAAFQNREMEARQAARLALERGRQDHEHELRQRILSEMEGGGVSGSPDGRSRSSTADLRMQALAALMDDPSLRREKPNTATVREYETETRPEWARDNKVLDIVLEPNPKFTAAEDAYRKARTEAIGKMLGQRAAPAPSTVEAYVDAAKAVAAARQREKEIEAEESGESWMNPLSWGRDEDKAERLKKARQERERAEAEFMAALPAFQSGNINIPSNFITSDAPAERGGRDIEISVEPAKPAPKAATGGKRLRVLKSGERILATDEELENFRKSNPARRRKLLEKLKAD